MIEDENAAVQGQREMEKRKKEKKRRDQDSVHFYICMRRLYGRRCHADVVLCVYIYTSQYVLALFDYTSHRSTI